mgnify:CR=1 FL=1
MGQPKTGRHEKRLVLGRLGKGGNGGIGLGMALGVLAEVVVLWQAPRLEALGSIRGLFLVSFGGTALRWLLVGSTHEGWAVLGLQLLHGLTFGLFWATSVRALSQWVPAPMRATGQALFGALVFGLGVLAMRRLVTRRLMALNQAMARAEKGDFLARVPVEGGDEIAEVAKWLEGAHPGMAPGAVGSA